jgi:two-component system CheB/CheR fusion protein
MPSLPNESDGMAGGDIMPRGERRNGAVPPQTRLPEAIVDNAASAYIAIDTNGIVVFLNSQARRMLEVGEEAVDRKLIELDTGLPVQQLEPAVRSVIAGGEVVDIRVNAVERRGRPIRCRVRVSPLLYEDRASHGAVLFVEEIAEAERAV